MAEKTEAASGAEIKGAEAQMKAKVQETAAAPKKAVSKKAEEKKTEQNRSEVKAAVITGANPNVEFYRITDDLPIYLL